MSAVMMLALYDRLPLSIPIVFQSSSVDAPRKSRACQLILFSPSAIPKACSDQRVTHVLKDGKLYGHDYHFHWHALPGT